MKLKFLVALLLSVFSMSSVFADTATDNKKKDEQILGVLIVINNNEIAAAKVVEKRKVTPEVKDYAKMMDTEHNKNLKQTISLSNKIGKPIKDSDAKSIEKQGKKELAELKPLKDEEFQNTYINTMVKDHQEALNTIDDNLLKNVTNKDLKKHLEATRTHVEQHLEKAKEIQGQLKTNS